MNELIRSIPTISKIIKYALLSLVFAILLMGAIWLILPAEESAYPPHAYDNTDDLGASILKASLSQQYSLVQNRISLLELSYSPDSVLLIIQPERTYSIVEMDYLRFLVSQGQAVIILGSNTAAIRLLDRFGYDVYQEPIYDYTQNYGSPSFLKAASFNDQTVLLVKPFSIYDLNYYPFNPNSFENYGAISLVHTYESSVVVEDPEYPLNGPYDVILQDPRYNLIVGADGWSFSNFALNLEPRNADLLKSLIQLLGNFKSIILEESAYAWVSTSKTSALNVMSSFFLRITINPWFILTTWIALPLLAVFGSGVLRSKEDRSELGKRISQRLRDLNIKKVPLLTLTMEEQFLTKHGLWQGYHRFSYFAMAAEDYLKEIQENKLSEVMPTELIHALKTVQNKSIPENLAWQILEDVALALEILRSQPSRRAKEIFQQKNRTLGYGANKFSTDTSPSHEGN